VSLRGDNPAVEELRLVGMMIPEFEGELPLGLNYRFSPHVLPLSCLMAITTLNL
jgi:hypothetical protein